MGTKFSIGRILMLIAVVAMLTAVYFMARVGYSPGISSLTNPSRPTTDKPVSIEPRGKKSGWLVLEDSEDSVSVALRDSVDLALECMGYAPEYSTTATRRVLDAVEEGVIVTATRLEKVGDIGQLLAYARTGGTLVFAIRPEVDGVFRSVYQQMGIYEHGYLIESKGINLDAGLLTDEPYVVEGDWLYNSAIELHVEQICDVYAVNGDGVPLIWSLPYGQGQILFMNNSLMTRKASGGLMISLLARIKEPLIYPIINARVAAVESFPLPSDINREYISQVYMRSGETFLRDIWWGDMVRFSRTSGIPLTAGLLTGYESEDAYPSNSVMNEELDLVFYAKEISRYDGELALSGFNQKPLYFGELTDNMDFEKWSGGDVASIRTAEAMGLFEQYFPQYGVYAFLPHERLLDDRGYDIIRQVMPDLQVIGGDFHNRELWYQDFGVDENGIASFPVITKGFEPSLEDEWNLLCAANALGVVFHSCSAADLLLETNPDRSWNKISRGFFDFTDEILSETGYLEGLTLTDASRRLRRMLALNADSHLEGDLLRVTAPPESLSEEAYFMLHCPGKKPLNVEGVDIQKISDGRYFITSAVPQFTLKLVIE